MDLSGALEARDGETMSGVLTDLKAFARYARAFRGFVRHPLTEEDCRERVLRQLQARAETFLQLIEHGIFDNPKSPYRRLLQHAGIQPRDVAHLVEQDGIDGALAALYDAGVYVTLDEFKGRRPIQRPGLEFAVTPADFDNPLLASAYEARTGGSRGAGRRIAIDLELLTHEAAYDALFLAASGLAERPLAVWHPVPPWTPGMKSVLRHLKHGGTTERWFAHGSRLSNARKFKHFLFTTHTILSSRLWGAPLPFPEPVPLEGAARVARWLAEKTAAKTPAVLATTPSSAVRVCLAAAREGLDVAGSVFRVVGEPLTAAKADVIEATGSRAIPHYSMSEVGNIGIACALPRAVDDVHFLSDKLEVIQLEKTLPRTGQSVRLLCFTTLLPSCPKLMLNVESDDYAVLEERVCGCAFGELGFRHHLHGIRSYEKLTSEGMTVLTSDIVALVDDVLPGRFGGHPTDYQFVEEEDGGLPKVSLLVSPRVGDIDEGDMVKTVLTVLSGAGRVRIMDLWGDGDTVRVLRSEPHATASAKVLPLHVLS